MSWILDPRILPFLHSQDKAGYRRIKQDKRGKSLNVQDYEVPCRIFLDNGRRHFDI
jgi:hypothetical protein